MSAKKKGKKKEKINMVGNEMAGTVVKRFMRTYEKNCLASETAVVPSLKKKMKACDEGNLLLDQIILEPVEANELNHIVVSLIPLVNAMRQERYTYIKYFGVWRVFLCHESCATLALLLEKTIYAIVNLDLVDCLIDQHSALRLAQSFNFCPTLTTVVLDHNEFGDEGCIGVCEGMQRNKTIISLSMCYCKLTKISGLPLGQIVTTTAVRELYLDGNDLECEGTIEIIKMCADFAQEEAFIREQEKKRKEEPTESEAGKSGASDSESKKGPAKKKKKKKKKKEPPPPPKVGPWIHKLHIADNGIDAQGNQSTLAPLLCMHLFRRLITYSSSFEELDLEDNFIGDGGGRELMEGLYCRKESKLPGVKIRTTHRMSAETFNTLLKLGTGLSKKKKGKKKKK